MSGLIKKAPGLAITLIALLFVWGCGGDDNADRTANTGDQITVETGSLTKAAFVERADEICRARSERVEAQFNVFLKRHADLGSSQAEQGAAATEVVETIYLPAGEEQIDQISSLGAPAGDEQLVISILKAIRKGMEEAEDHPLRFVRALSIDYKPFAEAERLASAYGFTDCGKG